MANKHIMVVFNVKDNYNTMYVILLTLISVVGNYFGSKIHYESYL